MGSVTFSMPLMAGLADMPVAGAAVVESSNLPDILSEFETEFAVFLGEIIQPAGQANPWTNPHDKDCSDRDELPIIYAVLPVPPARAPLPLEFSEISLRSPGDSAPAISQEPTAPLRPASSVGETAASRFTQPGAATPDLAAFSGLLSETANAEPFPQTQAVNESPRPPALPQHQTLDASTPVEKVPFEELKSTGNAPDVWVAPSTPENPLGRGNEASAETASAPPAAAKDGHEVESESPLPQPLTRTMQVHLGDDSATRVHVRLAERGGQVHFDVRTSNSEFAGALREGLPGLVRSLQGSGYNAEIWRPGNAPLQSSQDGTGSRDSRGDLPDHRRQREPQAKVTRNRSRRWRSLLSGFAQS